MIPCSASARRITRPMIIAERMVAAREKLAGCRAGLGYWDIAHSSTMGRQPGHSGGLGASLPSVGALNAQSAV